MKESLVIDLFTPLNRLIKDIMVLNGGVKMILYYTLLVVWLIIMFGLGFAIYYKIKNWRDENG